MTIGCVSLVVTLNDNQDHTYTRVREKSLYNGYGP